MQRFSAKNSSAKSNVVSSGRSKLTVVQNDARPITHVHRTSQVDISNLFDIAERVAESDYSVAANILNHRLEQLTNSHDVPATYTKNSKSQNSSCSSSSDNRNKSSSSSSSDSSNGSSTSNDTVEENFDYIVVGTGPAGAVVANRLMKGGKTVLLLEAGDDNSADPEIRTTGDAGQQLATDFPEYYWQGNTIDQQQSFGIMNQWTSGRLLGGASSINGYQVVSAIADGAAYWNDVAALVGDDRWNGANMQARMKKLEEFTAYGFLPDATRGTRGEWSTVTRPVYVNETGPGSDEYKLANMYSDFFGVPIVDDYNTSLSPVSVAFTRWQLNQIPNENMDRESADIAFIKPFVDSKGNGIGIAKNKLRLLVKATVVKLLFDSPTSKRCIGVAFTRNGDYHRVYAKEVILCTNFNTSQILQVNGMGPASVLTEAEVTVRQTNEHIGRHLINHPLIQLWFLDTTGNLTGLKDPREPAGSLYTGGAFQEYPDFIPGRRAIQWIFITYPAGPGTTLVLAIPLILLPMSEGSIKIQNTDPLKIVLADTNYYNDRNGTNIFPPLPEGNSSVNNEPFSLDLALMRQAARDMRDMLLSNGIIPYGDVVPGQNLSSADYDSDAALNAAFKLQNVQPHHWQNEVRMGTSISNGATSSTGKVLGIKGLRVAGAPILPPLPGNMATPSLLAGQVIAEAILSGQ